MEKKYLIISSLLVCLALYYIEQVLKVDYLVKTLSKWVLFMTIPWIYMKWIKKRSWAEFLKIKKMDKKDFKYGLILGGIAFSVILVTFEVVKGQMDLLGIVGEMKEKTKITADNFLWVGAYITFGNSFLEEFFFRGFLFLNLFQMGDKRTAYGYSSILFAVYHLAIFKTWFDPLLMGLALIGLFVVGLVFDRINVKNNNIFNSWIVHSLADMAIIFIGMGLFGMI